MVKIEAIIHPSTVESVKGELRRLGVQNVAVSQVWIPDSSGMSKVHYRGAEYALDSPYIKFEAYISSLQLDEVTGAILKTAHTSLAGDAATLAVFECADAVRIRDGQRVGLTAI